MKKITNRDHTCPKRYEKETKKESKGEEKKEFSRKHLNINQYTAFNNIVDSLGKLPIHLPKGKCDTNASNVENLLNNFENVYSWVKNHPIYSQGLISKNGEIASIIINLDDSVNDHDSREITIKEIEFTIHQLSNYTWRGSGIPVMRTSYIQFVNNERSIFLPIAFIVVTLVLFILLELVKPSSEEINSNSIFLLCIYVFTTFMYLVYDSRKPTTLLFYSSH